MRGLLRAALFGAVTIAALLAVAGTGRAALPPCDPATPAALALVAPDTLPTGFPAGAYLESSGPGYPDGPDRYSLTRTHIDFEPATPGGRLEHRYRGRTESDRDLYGRWPLRFARGDGPGRVTVTYGETGTGARGLASCLRTLTQVITPEAVSDPRVKLDRPKVSNRIIISSIGTGRRRVTVKITGRTARAAPRGVRLDVYEGRLIRFLKRVKVRDRRLSATVKFTLDGGSQLGPIRVRARYPGDTPDTWPCDDVFSTSSDDRCTTRLTFPRA